MPNYDFDLLTIGAGSGGVRASRVAAKLGVRVGLVEGGPLGGTCVNVGCVPKKLFWYAAHFGHGIGEAAGFGWSTADKRFDWPTLKANKDAEIKRLNGIYDRLLTGAEVTQVRGWATVTGPHEVRVETPEGTRTLTAERILIATGGKPWRPPVHGAELGWDSDDMFELEALPARIAINGGGYIAVEFASILAGLGVEVTLIHRGAMVLTGFDHEVRHFLGEQLKLLGVKMLLNHSISDIERGADGLEICTETGGMVVADGLLFATGRRPNTADLGLQAIGVQLDPRGYVVIDDHFQTSVPSVFALGDVVGRAALTPVAIEEAMVLVRQLYRGEKDAVMDYTNIPTAVFSEPPVGTVGLTEHEARKRGPVDVFVSEFKPMAATLSGATQRTFMKCIVDRESQRVLGLHMVGDHAGEIIQGLGVAMKCGVTKAQLDATVGIHPTAAEEFVTMREARVEEAD